MEVTFRATLASIANNLGEKELEEAIAASGCLKDVDGGWAADIGNNSIAVEIHTFWSGFYYNITADGDKYSCFYCGSSEGFLKQTLLPAFENVEVLVAHGTYGDFEGPDAFQQYVRTKSLWYAHVAGHSADGLLGEGDDASFDKVAAKLWNLLTDEQQESLRAEALNLENPSWIKDPEILRSMGWAGTPLKKEGRRWAADLRLVNGQWEGCVYA